MKKHFYSHLIEIDTLHTALDILELEDDEKKELIVIVESSIHHVVIDTVLSELSPEDKKKFLQHLAEDKHENIWQLLKEKATGIEDKIRDAVANLTKEFHLDIHEAHKKKPR